MWKARGRSGGNLLLAVALVAFGGSARAEDICQVPNVDQFLDRCPTNDPAFGRILSDFTITKNGAPVSFPAGSCTEPVSAMPIAQYTNELSAVQALRFVYYLDRDRCGHLPWTPLSLYDWLKSKVSGFNIDSTASYDSCCTIVAGRPTVTLRAADDANREYHRTWEGVAEWIALLMHEARHRDPFPHVTCCPAQQPGGPASCDQTYDETSLSPYGIQYWLEKAWVDGRIHTGYTCLAPARTTAIKNWLRSAANGRPSNFCTNAPPILTDANNAPPPCDQRCAASVTCVAPAMGVPPIGGPPRWWSTSPPEPAYHDRLDDPRWAGASSITYGDGTGQKAEFRALHDAGYLYLSWRAFVAPASTPGQNALYFGYRPPAGSDVIVKIGLTALTPASASASQMTLQAFARNSDGTEGPPVTPPPEIPASARVWVDAAAPGSWAVQLRIPTGAFQTTCGRFQMWYQLLAGTPTAPVASFTWPRTGVGIDGGTAASPHPAVYPDPATWHWLRPSTGAGDDRCATAGVSIDYASIGTTNTPASQINYRATSPFPVNRLFARPTNHSGATIPAGAITATFRLANWGSLPDWEQGVPVGQLWAPIPGGTDVPTSGPIADGAKADATNEAHFDWTVGGTDLSDFLNGVRRPHQCLLVELKSKASPGLTFANSSVYRNMDFVKASTFRRDALLSVRGLPATASGSRDVYVYVETHGMPQQVKVDGRRDARAVAATKPPEAMPTYRVHVYHDTGNVLTEGGVTRPVLSYQTSFGYYVTHQGPLEGWRHQIEGAGLVALAPNWYRIQVPHDGEVQVTTTVTAVEPLPGSSPWSLSLQLGPNFPTGSTASRYDVGPGGGITAEYQLGGAFAVEAFFGFDPLRGSAGVPNLRLMEIYASGRAYLGSQGLRPFALAGAGAYALDPGTLETGVHAGAGVQLELTPRFAVEATAKFHAIPSVSPSLHFVTVHAGARLRF